MAETLTLFNKVLAQEKNSKNKIYSSHEPDVYCVAKGKAHKKYEYGCKGSVVLTQNTGIIVGAMTFEENVLMDIPLMLYSNKHPDRELS